MKMPTFDKLMLPTLKALESLGGSGSIEEIANAVIQALNLSESITSQAHNPEKSSQTEVEYRLAWARTYLKKYGLVDNSERGVWALTAQYEPGQPVDVDAILQKVRGSSATKTKKRPPRPTTDDDLPLSMTEEVEADWKEALHQTLLQLKPDAFERLAMRLLRESGFVQVEVTGRTGDGGIDGKGIIKLQNVLSYLWSFNVSATKKALALGPFETFAGP